MAQQTGLRRELNVWQAVGLSLALMAPSMAANINPQGTAGSVGRAVPLAFALATAGVLLIEVVVAARGPRHAVRGRLDR